MRASLPLVGRCEEAERVATLVKERVGGIVLCGEAGIGKTRLATEAARLAEEQGRAVTWVSATPATASMPLGAIAHLLGPPNGALEGHAVGVDRLQQAVQAITRSATPAGLVLVIDDAPHLDEVTAALVLQMAREDAVFVVATIRHHTAVPEPIVRLWTEGMAERIDLWPLAEPDANLLVEELVGGPVDAQTQQRLWRLTQGNPLFVAEVVREALDVGTIALDEGIWTSHGPFRASARLEDTIESRLADVTPAQRRLLDLVALAEPLELHLLVAVLGDELLPGLERAGLVRLQDADREPRVLLAHPLYAEVLRGRLPVSLRRRELGNLAAAAADHPLHRDERIRVAVWQLESGGEVEPGSLVEAAEQANALRDRSLAVRLATSAEQLAPTSAGALALAEANNALLRFEEAAAILQPLVDDAGALDDEQRVALAVHLQDCTFWGMGDADASEVALARVRSHAATDAARQQIDALAATAHLLSGRTDEAAVLAVAFVDDPTIDDMARLRAVPALAALTLQGNGLAALERMEAITPLVVSSMERSPRAPAWLLAARVLTLYLVGRIDEAEQLAQVSFEMSRARSDEDLGTTAMAVGVASVLRGKPQSALTWLRQALLLLKEHDPDLLRPWTLALAGWSEALRDDPTAAEGYAGEARATHRPSLAIQLGHLDIAEAWIAYRRGERSRAVAMLRRSAARSAAQHQRVAEGMLLHEAVRLGGRGEILATLIDTATVVDGDLAAAWAAHARALAADDGDALGACAARFAALGMPLLEAECWAESGDALDDAGRASPARSARARSQRALQACEGAVVAGLATTGGPTSLTAREREVAGLAARGLSNSEIAARLTVSVRTVEGHLYNSYVKLGVTDRSELPEMLDLTADPVSR